MQTVPNLNVRTSRMRRTSINSKKDRKKKKSFRNLLVLVWQKSFGTRTFLFRFSPKWSEKEQISKEHFFLSLSIPFLFLKFWYLNLAHSVYCVYVNYVQCLIINYQNDEQERDQSGGSRIDEINSRCFVVACRLSIKTKITYLEKKKKESRPRSISCLQWTNVYESLEDKKQKWNETKKCIIVHDR